MDTELAGSHPEPGGDSGDDFEGNRMNILVAEDQVPTAFLIRRKLERLGHSVTVASDGLEAWRIVRESRFSVVISDWVMPRMDGPELCRAIRDWEGQPYCYLILLTFKQSREERLEGLRAGADDFLVKPPDFEELAIRLEIARRILSVQDELRRNNKRLAELALTDELTGVYNRRRFRESLAIHHARALRMGVALSLVILDVDQFKSYNDAFGHPAGDEVLRRVARTLVGEVREHDEVARIGGEEFAILLPDTESKPAIALAERFRTALANKPWPLQPLTASLGVATTLAGSTSASVLVDQADLALYRCKRAGRDRVGHFLDDEV